MRLWNTSKFKIDTILLLIGSNVAELHHQRDILTDILGKVKVHPNVSSLYETPICLKIYLSS